MAKHTGSDSDASDHVVGFGPIGFKLVSLAGLTQTAEVSTAQALTVSQCQNWD